MGIKCLVCCTKPKKTKPAISFHHFPRDLEMRRKWMRVLGKPGKYSMICSRHFEHSDFHNYFTKTRRLKPEVVPSLLLHGSLQDRSSKPQDFLSGSKKNESDSEYSCCEDTLDEDEVVEQPVTASDWLKLLNPVKFFGNLCGADSSDSGICYIRLELGNPHSKCSEHNECLNEDGLMLGCVSCTGFWEACQKDDQLQSWGRCYQKQLRENRKQKGKYPIIFANRGLAARYDFEDYLDGYDEVTGLPKTLGLEPKYIEVLGVQNSNSEDDVCLVVRDPLSSELKALVNEIKMSSLSLQPLDERSSRKSDELSSFHAFENAEAQLSPTAFFDPEISAKKLFSGATFENENTMSQATHDSDIPTVQHSSVSGECCHFDCGSDMPAYEYRSDHSTSLVTPEHSIQCCSFDSHSFSTHGSLSCAMPQPEASSAGSSRTAQEGTPIDTCVQERVGGSPKFTCTQQQLISAARSMVARARERVSNQNERFLQQLAAGQDLFLKLSDTSKALLKKRLEILHEKEFYRRKLEKLRQEHDDVEELLRKSEEHRNSLMRLLDLCVENVKSADETVLSVEPVGVAVNDIYIGEEITI